MTLFLFFINFRFELALYALLAKGSLCKTEQYEQDSSSSSEMGIGIHSDSYKAKGKNLTDSCTSKRLESEIGRLNITNSIEGHNMAHNFPVEIADHVVDYQTGVSDSKQQVKQAGYAPSKMETVYTCNMNQSSSVGCSYPETDRARSSWSYVEMPGASSMAMEGPSEEDSCYRLNNNSWLVSDQSKHSSMDSPCGTLMVNDWGRCSMPDLSWGGRVVDRRQVRGYDNANCGVHGEDYDAFVNIFEGGSILYCNMSFEALLNVRKQLEELGFPCNSLNDGLWLQVYFSNLIAIELLVLLLKY